MRFSIIIPNLNSPIIHLTIEALLQQCQSEADEILVIGLDELGLVKPSALVQFIDTGAPASPAVARNIGIRRARGEVVCFLDADCIPCADWLQRIEQQFQEPTLAVLGGGVDTSQTGFWTICDHVSTFHDYLATASPGTRAQLPSLNLMIRKTVLDQVGGFDERYPRPAGEDADLTTRLRLDGYALRFDPQIAVNHVPNRPTLAAALKHARQLGRYSIKIDPRWRATLHPPLPLRHWSLVLLTAPLLALAVTLGIYQADRTMQRWWYMAPAIFGLKLAWCWGAAEGMQ